MSEIRDTMLAALQAQGVNPSILQRPTMVRSMSYGFPPTTIEPGTKMTISVNLRGPFRPQKLIMVGLMDVIRGHFRIKRSRLVRVDRDNVIDTYTRIRKWKNQHGAGFTPGKTTITYLRDGENFTREYLPSSVVYVPTDPLEYIVLRNIFFGTEAAMPLGQEGVPGMFFGTSMLSNSLPLPTSTESLSLLLANEGDIPVRVSAMIFGRSWT